MSGGGVEREWGDGLGVLGRPKVRLALGLLRLGIEGRPGEKDAVELIRYALDRGVRLLDTADVYALTQREAHYGERLAARAIASWGGPRDEVRVLTKAGLSRPSGRWVPAGRPEQLRKAVLGSLKALEVERLFLLQLHSRDPLVPLEETLAALAELQREGLVEHLGLCNVGPVEVRQAQRHFAVATVQNELSVLNRKSAGEGSVVAAGRWGVPLLAHRPLGGHAKVERLARNRVANALAEKHGVSPHQAALAVLLDLGEHVVPLFGATRRESVAAACEALQVRLDDEDRRLISSKCSFEPDPRAERLIDPPRDPATLPPLSKQSGPGEEPEVVLLAGIQGAGKSQLVRGYVQRGYERLNRDELGGTLEDLIPPLERLLSEGRRRVVLDNTYPTRTSRAAVIAAAHAHDVPVRCRHLATALADARINVCLRMLERYGRLLGPDDMKRLDKDDPNLPPPRALDRHAACCEPPRADEGFAAVERIEFRRRPDPSRTGRGLLLEVDVLRESISGEKFPVEADDQRILPGRREALRRWVEDGVLVLLVTNRSAVASGRQSQEALEAELRRTAELLELPVADTACCPHPAFPLGCFCRKPLPGLGVLLARKHGLADDGLTVVGSGRIDAQFAAGLGARYFETEAFFAAE